MILTEELMPILIFINLNKIVSKNENVGRYYILEYLLFPQSHDFVENFFLD